MSDISKCEGKGIYRKKLVDCNMKHLCYRYTASVNELWQSYFTEIKLKSPEKGCGNFWKNSSAVMQIGRQDILEVALLDIAEKAMTKKNKRKHK